MPDQSTKPKLLVINHIPLTKLESGQHLRVHYSLLAAKAFFHVTMLSNRWQGIEDKDIAALKDKVDELILLPRVYGKNKITKYLQYLKMKSFVKSTGLKTSNYILGELEFTPERIDKFTKGRKFDLVLFEYNHAYKAANVFTSKGTPTLIDTHNILWQRHMLTMGIEDVSLASKDPKFLAYKNFEENSWKAFDGIVSINANEDAYIRKTVDKELFLVPMGIDLSNWDYCWNPRTIPNLAFYGGMSNAENVAWAAYCVKEVMPTIWSHYPDATFSIIGSKPRQELKDLAAADKRVIVTGFVEDVKQELAKVHILLCPWKGKFGFRSRLVETMAVGVPMIIAPDAADGMGIPANEGTIYQTDPTKMGEQAVAWLQDMGELNEQSRRIRKVAETQFSFETTYLAGWERIAHWATHYRQGI